MRPKIIFEIYESGRPDNRQWYWRARRKRGGRIVADGAEGYYKLGNAKRAVYAFTEALGTERYEVVVLGLPKAY